MKNFITIVAILTMGTFSCYSIAEDGHDHDHKSERHESGHDRDHDHKNENHDEHEHEEEEDEKHGHHGDKENRDSHEGHNDHDDHGSEDSHGHGHGEESFGEGKAITAVFNEGEKFKLSIESEKLLGIKTSPLELAGGSKYKISNESLVRYQNHLGVFVKKDGWFVLIKLEKAQPKENYFVIESTELYKGEQIVNSGVSLLRVAHLQASGQGGKGHAH